MGFACGSLVWVMLCKSPQPLKYSDRHRAGELTNPKKFVKTIMIVHMMVKAGLMRDANAAQNIVSYPSTLICDRIPI
jgi:hypothetical protein